MADHADPREGAVPRQSRGADAETAIERAIEHFDIDEAHRSRLIAEPVE